MKSILIVIGHWPSKTHPYLVWLFFRLKQVFPELILFHFGQPELEYGYSTIGQEAVEQVMKGSLYRKPFSRNIFLHIWAGMIIIVHLKQCIRIFLHCRAQGLSPAQAYGQLYYYQELLGRNFDLVHINALQTARHFRSKHLFGKAAVIASSRGQDFDFFPNRYDAVLQEIDHLHVLGTYLEAKARERGYKGPISIIPPAFPPLDTEILTRELHNEEIIIATAARLFWTKGYRYSLLAIKELVQSGYKVRYRIFGEGEEREKLIFIVHSLELTNHVDFVGWLSESQLIKELTNAHIYLLLSIEEGFNNSVLLAQAMGIPCVVSDAGGLPENVADGVSGRVVPRYDAAAAVGALIQLIDNPGIRIQMGAAARDRVKNNFSLENQVAQCVAMFEKVIA